MLALTVVVLWFGLVAVYLVRQWWLSELAQAGEGVPAPAPVTLPAVAPTAQVPERRRGGLGGGAPAVGRWGRAYAPTCAWSARYATSPAAR